LNLVQNITDGGIYNPMQVTSFKKNSQTYKPGLESLSDFYSYKNHRSLHVGPLANTDWLTHIKNNEPPDSPVFKKLDSLAYEHLTEFWSHYNIAIDFKVEHKVDRTPSLRAAYMGKAHYACIVYNKETGQYETKTATIRGFKNDLDIDYLNPISNILLSILDKDDEIRIENFGIYQVKKIIRVNGWKQGLENPKSQNPGSKYGPNVDPGSAFLQTRKFSLICAMDTLPSLCNFFSFSF
jgi:hypothetical protein